MTNRKKIIESLAKSGSMCDDCLSSASMVKPRQTVNSECRFLEQQEMLNRRKDLCSQCKVTKLVNELAGKKGIEKNVADAQQTPKRNSYIDQSATSNRSKNHDVEALSEDEIKKVLADWLVDDGWEVEVAWGHTPGIDVEAKKGEERWVIEAKGPGSRQPMRVNYFIGILGETLQRMDDSSARYSIALPDLQQYRRLWERLPKVAKERTRISIIFVSLEGSIDHLESIS